MAKNPDFLKVTFKDVALKWPRLDRTYRFNSQKKETEACDPRVQGAGWSVAWEVEKAEAIQFRESVMAHYNACRVRKPELPEFTKIFGAKRDDERGVVIFTASKKAIANNGDMNKPPQVVDGAFNDLADKGIWSGSQGGVRIFAVPTTDPDGAGGIKLLLDTVVVTEPVYGGDNLEEDFGPPRHVQVHRSDDFAPAAQARAPQPVQPQVAPPPAQAPVPQDVAF